MANAAEGTPIPPNPPLAPRRPDWRFLRRHPAHLLALGAGCGLSRWAPGTVGTLGAWLSFVLLDPHLSDAQWGLVLAGGWLCGWWAATVTAQHLAQTDPGAIVIDEILAFWTMLWLVLPAGWLGQLVAFALFRFFDAVKPGPVAWADRLFKARRGEAIGWRQGLGVMVDDAVAALCALLLIALWRF
jgi:phosphatidylglycerophosphatase A